MLTEADDRPDGQFVRYWEQPERWRRYDPPLFDALSRCKSDATLRHVEKAELWQILPRAKFFNRLLTDKPAERQSYFREALEALASCEVIFFDPDNGIEIPSVRYGTRSPLSTCTGLRSEPPLRTAIRS